MSQTGRAQESGHHNDFHNPFKWLISSTDKTVCAALTTSLKGVAAFLLLASVSVVLYSAFTTEPRFSRCPDYPDPSIQPDPDPHPNPTPTNISHIVFGIGGSARTWKDRRRYSELWWRPNLTRGFVWLDEQPDPDDPYPVTSPPYRVSSPWKQFKFSSSQSAVRIARVVVDSFRVGLRDVRWFVMGDDDTVFFTENLVSVLSRYDYRKMYYVGGNSESVEQDVMHSYGMAFGGGGFAISYPLAAELARKMDGCLDRYYNFYGSDQRVWACVGELGVELTTERGFHQIDIRGDPFGLLAAHPLAPLVSLHHLDSVNPLFPNQTQLQSLNTLNRAYKVDPARTLQQCFCYHRTLKWSVSVSWGYSVQIYPSLMTARELEMPLQTFKTWRSWKDGPFTFNTRPVNPDPCHQPVVFYLDWSREGEDGETLTGYRKFGSSPEKKCLEAGYARAEALESVIVSSSKMDPYEWKKAPQRHCCEISSRTFKNHSMYIRIRNCKHKETVTI